MSIGGPPPFDLSTLGTDINLGMSDLAGVWGRASGLTNLGNAWLRRLSCPAGGLFYDLDYGHDVIALLNGSFSPAEIASEQADCAAEIEKDERCDTCRCSIQLNQATEEMFVVLDGKLATGAPFQFIIKADRLTVDLISINGVLAPGSAIATAAAAAGGPVQLVVGPPGGAGAPGPKGDTGSSGTAQVILDFDESIGLDSDGVQTVVYQRLVNFDALQATVTFELVANVYSVAGTASFKMSYGGTNRVADGTQVGSTMTTGSSTPVPLNVSATIANPGGKRLVKITLQSSANGVECGMLDRTLTIR